MAIYLEQPYPVGQIDLALLRDELQDTRVRHAILVPIYQLEEHGVRDVQSCQFVERAGRHYDLSSVVHVLSLGTRQHGDGVTAVVFVEAARWHAACSTQHAWGKHAGHGVVVLIKTWVELMVKVSAVAFESSQVGAGTIFKVVRLDSEWFGRGSGCVDSEKMRSWRGRGSDVVVEYAAGSSAGLP